MWCIMSSLGIMPQGDVSQDWTIPICQVWRIAHLYHLSKSYDWLTSKYRAFSSALSQENL